MTKRLLLLTTLIAVHGLTEYSPGLLRSLSDPIQTLEEMSILQEPPRNLEDMPSNHNSDSPLVPQLRRSGGQIRITWSGIRERIINTAEVENISTETLKSFTSSVYINGVEVAKGIPWEQTVATFKEPPSGQMDYYIVYKNGDEPVDISKWAMRETADGQNIHEQSFTGQFAGEAFGFNLNSELKAQGFNEELSSTSVRLGNLKVVWVMSPKADSSVQNFIKGAAAGVDVKPLIGANGEPESVTIYDRETKKTLSASAQDFHFKVDAAFNGNAFYWDDMLVALATAPYHPWLAKSTMEFWLEVQAQNGGVIPREVRKDSLISLWFPENVRFPEKAKTNLSYTNPYLMNWVADKLYRYNPSEENLDFLKRVSKSVQNYVRWMEKNRSIRDAEGKIIGFNGSALGSGLDNSRNEIGNDNEEAGHNHAFVDFISQHISMLKDDAKWNLIFVRKAKNSEEKAAYLAQAKESHRRAMYFTKTLNENYWNQDKGFYYDLDRDAKGVFTQDLAHTVISGFWPLYAAAADTEKVDRIVETQFNPEGFGGNFPFPANARRTITEGKLSRYKPREFVKEDGYWDKWAHWPSMAMAALTGLRRSGRPDLAHKMAAAFIKKMAESSSKTVEESYGEIRVVDADGSINFISRPIEHASHPHRADFAGWGKGPGLENTLEDGLGLAPTYRRGFDWNLRTTLKTGDKSDIIGVKAIQYMGGNISYMNLRRIGENSYELSVMSEKPFEMRLGSLLDSAGQLHGESQSRSGVVKVVGNNKPQTIRVDLKPLQANIAHESVWRSSIVAEGSSAKTSCESLFTK